jgi:hypothetical protein
MAGRLSPAGVILSEVAAATESKDRLFAIRYSPDKGCRMAPFVAIPELVVEE